jgi:hypothetical protein
MNSDKPTKAIVAALRAAGVSVHYIEPVGFKGSGGLPDLLAGHQGRTFLLEVKSPKGQLNDEQKAWHAAWRGFPVVVVRDEVEALRAVGLQA